jgi:hypothetical protein
VPNFEGIGAICAPLKLDGTSVDTGTDQHLPVRGVGGATSSVHCPAGEVVSEFWGGAHVALNSPTVLGFRCAKLGLTRADREARVGVAVTGHDDYFGAPVPGGTSGSEPCPTGQLANGLYIRANDYVNAIGITCTTPTLAYPEGATCTIPLDCLSATCSTTCKRAFCPSIPTECSCVNYLQSPYVICTAGRLNKNAEYACGQFGMHLPKLVSPYEAAWLSSLMFMKDASRFWVGAKYDDSQSPAGWAWDVDASLLVPPATADDEYNLWKSVTAADPSGGKACLVMDGGNYVSANCDEVHPFACQFAR